jgi:transcriptional regulator with XRE-family HTH domain
MKNELAHRVRLLRKLHGMNQVEWAKFTGIPYKTWSHYELGTQPISRESVFTLREKIQWIKADWLWWGDTSGMTVGVVAQLSALEREEESRRVKGVKK